MHNTADCHHHVVIAFGRPFGYGECRVHECAFSVGGEFYGTGGFTFLTRRTGYEFGDAFGVDRESGTSDGECVAGCGFGWLHRYRRRPTAITDGNTGVVAGDISDGNDNVVIARFRAFGYDDGGAVERAVGVGGDGRGVDFVARLTGCAGHERDGAFRAGGE